MEYFTKEMLEDFCKTKDEDFNSDVTGFHVTDYEDICEDKAFEIEKDIIEHFGRLDRNEGILANHTDGGEGSGGHKSPKPQLRKKIYQYELNGKFVNEWESLFSVGEELGVRVANISTAIKRGGTAYEYIWSYDYLGKEIKDKKRYKMPNKFSDIKQIDVETGKVIKVFETALDIEKKLKLRKGARNKIYECINGRLKTAYGYKWKI